MRSEKILGVNVSTPSEDEILEFIITGLKRHRRKYFVVTPNPEILVFASKHESFRTILNKADVSLPDGAGLVWAAKLIGKKVKDRIAGVDLMEKLCERVSKGTEIVGFLGGRNNVAEEAAECLQKKYPGLKVGFAGGEWPSTPVTPQLDILFVAYGFPKQEEWIYQNLEKIPVTVAMGVGGAFDYLSGNVPRAPKVVRNLGFEWLFRLIVQPWRIKRQLALIEFMYLVMRDAFRQRMGKGNLV